MDIISLENLPVRTRQRLSDYYKRYPVCIRYGYNKREIDPDEDDDLYWDEIEGQLENYKEDRRGNE